MDWQTILAGAWAVLNSAPAIMLVATIAAFALARLYAAQPAWKAYEGTIISAIKYAEKIIPDATASKGAARLDEALRYVVRVYTQMHAGNAPSESLTAVLRDGIQIVHERLEAHETLK